MASLFILQRIPFPFSHAAYGEISAQILVESKVAKGSKRHVAVVAQEKQHLHKQSTPVKESQLVVHAHFRVAIIRFLVSANKRPAASLPVFLIDLGDNSAGGLFI